MVALSDLSGVQGREVLAAAVLTVNRVNLVHTVYLWRTAEHTQYPGTDTIPEGQDLGIGPENTRISAVRLDMQRISGEDVNVLLLNDNDQPEPLDLGSYFGGGAGNNVRIHIQTDSFTTHGDVNDDDDVGLIGNGFIGMRRSLMYTALNILTNGDTFILAFSRPQPHAEFSLPAPSATASVQTAGPAAHIAAAYSLPAPSATADVNISTVRLADYDTGGLDLSAGFAAVLMKEDDETVYLAADRGGSNVPVEGDVILHTDQGDVFDAPITRIRVRDTGTTILNDSEDPQLSVFFGSGGAGEHLSLIFVVNGQVFRFHPSRRGLQGSDFSNWNTPGLRTAMNGLAVGDEFIVVLGRVTGQVDAAFSLPEPTAAAAVRTQPGAPVAAAFSLPEPTAAAAVHTHPIAPVSASFSLPASSVAAAVRAQPGAPVAAAFSLPAPSATAAVQTSIQAPTAHVAAALSMSAPTAAAAVREQPGAPVAAAFSLQAPSASAAVRAEVPVDEPDTVTAHVAAAFSVSAPTAAAAVRSQPGAPVSAAFSLPAPSMAADVNISTVRLSDFSTTLRDVHCSAVLTKEGATDVYLGPARGGSNIPVEGDVILHTDQGDVFDAPITRIRIQPGGQTTILNDSEDPQLSVFFGDDGAGEHLSLFFVVGGQEFEFPPSDRGTAGSDFVNWATTGLRTAMDALAIGDEFVFALAEVLDAPTAHVAAAFSLPAPTLAAAVRALEEGEAPIEAAFSLPAPSMRTNVRTFIPLGFAIHVEFELTGRGHGWTNRTHHLMRRPGVRCERGFRSWAADDRVALAGRAEVVMRNASVGSAGRPYTPGDDAAEGFDLDVGMRLMIDLDDGEGLRPIWTGHVIEIEETVGSIDAHFVRLRAADYLDRAARMGPPAITLGDDVPIDLLHGVETLANAAPTTPRAVRIYFT